MSIGVLKARSNEQLYLVEIETLVNMDDLLDMANLHEKLQIGLFD